MVLILKKLLIALAVMAAILPRPCAAAEEEPAISAVSAVIMDGRGEVLYAKNADTPSLIASTTKLMTAFVTILRCDPDESVRIENADCAVEGSAMYLVPGESYTVRELLTGLLLASGNDAAMALARHVAGDTEAFAALMNRSAAALGMSGSHFVNPHGLNAEGHYATARDLAALMHACMDCPLFRELSALPSATVKEQSYQNHNKLLTLCPGCVAGKTGYTQLAGRCLVSCAERDGRRFVCVTLNDPNDWEDHCKLYDWAFTRL